MTKTVVGLFDTFQTADEAVRALLDAGFDRHDISLIAQDATHGNQPAMQGQSTDDVEHAGEGAAAGAGTGAVLGALAGLLVGIGALAIPGLGPIIAAGPLAAALAGAGIGAVAGGLIGALVEAGVPEEQARAYAEGVQHGGTLVTLRADDDRADQAREIMNRYHPIDMQNRSREWREAQQPDRMPDQQAYDTSGLSADRTEYSRDLGEHTADRQDWSVHDRDVAGEGTPALTEGQMAQRTSGGEDYRDQESEDMRSGSAINTADAGGMGTMPLAGGNIPGSGTPGNVEGSTTGAGATPLGSGGSEGGGTAAGLRQRADSTGRAGMGSSQLGDSDVNNSGMDLTGDATTPGDMNLPNTGTQRLAEDATPSEGSMAHMGAVDDTAMGNNIRSGEAGMDQGGIATTGSTSHSGPGTTGPGDQAFRDRGGATTGMGTQGSATTGTSFGADEGSADEFAWQTNPQSSPHGESQDLQSGQDVHGQYGQEYAQHHHTQDQQDDQNIQARDMGRSQHGEHLEDMSEGQDLSMQSMQGQDTGQAMSGGEMGTMQHGQDMHGQQMQGEHDHESRDLTGVGHGQWEERDVSAIVSNDTGSADMSSAHQGDAGMQHEAGGDEGWEGQGHDLSGRSTDMDRPRESQDQGLGANMSGSQQNAGMRDFSSFMPEFRSHYDMFLGGGQLDYSYYEPGYRYGYDLASSPRYRGKKWSEIEPDAQREWDQQHAGMAWSDFRDTVRYGWERTASSTGDFTPGSDENIGWTSDRPGSGTDLQQGQNFVPPPEDH